MNHRKKEPATPTHVGSLVWISTPESQSAYATSSMPMSYWPPLGSASPKKSSVADDRKVGAVTPLFTSGEPLASLYADSALRLSALPRVPPWPALLSLGSPW